MHSFLKSEKIKYSKSFLYFKNMDLLPTEPLHMVRCLICWLPVHVDKIDDHQNIKIHKRALKLKHAWMAKATEQDRRKIDEQQRLTRASKAKLTKEIKAAQKRILTEKFDFCPHCHKTFFDHEGLNRHQEDEVCICQEDEKEADKSFLKYLS
jgi:hypothetical protein